MTEAIIRPDLSLLTLDRLGPSFGAEVIGLDVRTATDDQVAAVRDALVTYKVLFLRGQDLTDDDQVELGRRIGDLTAAHPVVGGVDTAHPEGRLPGDAEGRFFRGSGTSQAAAAVSGAAALLFSAKPKLTPDQVKAALMRTASPLLTGGPVQGRGVADVGAALGLDARHELVHLYATALGQLGEWLGDAPLLDRLGDSAQAFAGELVAGMSFFADPGFHKRAQIAANDLVLAGVAEFAEHGGELLKRSRLRLP